MANSKSSTIQPVNKHIKLSEKISEKISDDDRISKLPEPVLHHILCFLSTEEAAKTSVLSKPWRYLWTCVPDLDISHFQISECWGRWGARTKDISLDSMFVNIFLSRRAWCIRKLRLTLSCSSDYDTDSIRSILCSAVERNVEELDLCIYAEFCQFPSSLFCCKTLVVLKMHSKIKIDIGSSVHLPSLKVLHLEDVQFEDADTVQNLFSGCPVLDSIVMGIYEIDTRFHYEISSLTARHVRFSLVTFDPFVPTKITVSAPALEYLTIDYNVELSPHVLVLNNVSSSVHATYNIRPGDGDEEIDDYWEPMKGIFGALCNVRFLELNFISIEEHPYLHNIPIAFFPGFDNLVQLKLVIDFCLLPMLLNMLPNCARLEHLTLVSKMCDPCTMSHSWISPQQVPNCLAFHLTTIIFERFQGFEAEVEFIQYVINNSKVLRSITIRYKNNTNLDRKLGAFQKISGFVKELATRCQLTFQQEL